MCQMLRIQQQRRNSSPHPYSKALLQGLTGDYWQRKHRASLRGWGWGCRWLRSEDGGRLSRRDDIYTEIWGVSRNWESVLQEREISIWLWPLSRLRCILPGRIYGVVEDSNPNIEQTVRESHRIRTYIALALYREGREGVLARGAADVGWASKNKWAGIENAGGQRQVHLWGPREENLRVNRAWDTTCSGRQSQS